jgi:hypothetical protein
VQGRRADGVQEHTAVEWEQRLLRDAQQVVAKLPTLIQIQPKRNSSSTAPRAADTRRRASMGQQYASATTKTALGFIVVLIVFGLGFWRLAYDKPQVKSKEIASIEKLAACLKPPVEIPIGTPVTLQAFPPPDPSKTASAAETRKQPPNNVKLDFVTIAPLQVDLLDEDPRRDRDAAPKLGPTAGAIKERYAVVTRTDASAAGAFEFHSRKPDLIVTRDGIPFLLRSSELTRFGPAAQGSYVIALSGLKTDDEKAEEVKKAEQAKAAAVKKPEEPQKPEETKAATAKRMATLPAGTRGHVYLDAGQTVVPVQPIHAFNWLRDTPFTLSAIRVSGQSGLADVAIEVRQPGLAFDASGFTMSACASTNGGIDWDVAGISETKAAHTGAARAMIVLPGGMLINREFWLPVHLAIASADGRYRGYGGFNAVSKGYAGVIAFAMTVAILAWLLTLRSDQLVRDQNVSAKGWSRWFAGLFIGPDNEPSLSLFQIFIWTTITVWGFIYVFIVSGSLLAMTTDMMTLLGIAGLGTIAARWLGTRGVTSTGHGVAAQSAASAHSKFELWKMLSTNGTFDLLKLQLFVFTLTIGAYVVYRILDTAAFPVLDANTLLLLGVSQGVYIGGKVAATTPLGNAQALKIDLEAKTEALKNREAELQALQDRETALKAVTAPSAAETAELQELPVRIKIKTGDRDAAKAAVDKAKTDYDKAVKELFPTPT